jgi:hypothetical protein
MPSKKEQLLESDDEGEGAIVNVSDTKKRLTRPGLPPHVALNFLDVLDSYGSPDCVSNQNRLIATVCNTDPANFGSPKKQTPRGRRRQVQNFITFFHKLSPNKRQKFKQKLALDAQQSHHLPLSGSNQPPPLPPPPPSAYNL